MKTKILVLATLLLSGYFFTSCKQNANEASTPAPTETPQETNVVKKESINRNFASEGYTNREKGEDWVKINIKSLEEDKVMIHVTSREDIKKPTCSLETEATKVKENVYQAILQDIKVNFFIEHEALTIDTENEGDRGILSYYCSGGGSLKGTYKSID